MSDEEQTEGPIIRDKRRIDPVTGTVRPVAASPATGGSVPPASASVPGAAAGGTRPDATSTGSGSADADRVVVLEMELAERTHDLQRVQAEYQNYRRRVDRDRGAVRDTAVAAVVTDLLPVLDDIGRAESHGELVGGFKSVADALGGVLTKLGVERFGEPGEPFDPARHEALMHSYSEEVSETTSVAILQPGYRLGDRIIRPARVAVADPAPREDAPTDGSLDPAEPELTGQATTPAPSAGRPGPDETGTGS